MKKLFFITTALVTLGGITAVAADVSISGNSRFRYHAWSDDQADTGDANNSAFANVLQLWVKADMKADSGLDYGVHVRLGHGSATLDRNYIYLQDDWGKVQLGKTLNPYYTMSLGADWRGTGVGMISAGGAPWKGDTKAITGSGGGFEQNTKIVYETPNISGLKVGIGYADAGGASKGDSTTMAINYSVDISDNAGLRFGYGRSSTAKTGSDPKQTDTEFGIEYSAGDFLLSAIRLEDKDGNDKGTATEFEVAYDATDELVLNLIQFNSKIDKGTHDGDKYKSTQIGAAYTVAPGMTVGVAHLRFDGDAKTGTDSDGNFTRVQFRVNF